MAKQSVNKKWIGIGIALFFLLIIVGVVWGSYNNLVKKSQDADKTWADVETQYQRRIDLIPNLVSVVESFARFERDTLIQITEIRSQWQSAQTPEQRVQTANQFESALSKLLLITENYPELRSSQNFISLQDSLAETENMMTVSRTRYNGAVRDYNTAVKVFPSNLVAGMFGFEEKTYFQASPGAEQAPRVNISI